MGWRPELQKEVYDANKPEARQHGCRQFQEARLKVLPAEDGSLPLWEVPAVDKESVCRKMLVVPVSDADSGSPLQGLPEVEGLLEDFVVRGAEGKRGVEE